MKSLLILLFVSTISLTTLFHSERFPYFNGLIYQKIGWNQKTFEMFDKACEANSIQGCIELGIMYENGHNISQAKKFYEKACKNNSGKGCFQQARAYSKSNDLKEIVQVFDLYRKSCDNDYGQACNLLGKLEQDPLIAKELFDKAR